MAQKTALTITCNYYVGGVYNFHRNILSHDTANAFDKKVIFFIIKECDFTKATQGFGLCPELVYEVAEDIRDYTKEIAQLIGSEKGVIVTNFEPELQALHFFPKPYKTVIFICHDQWYVDHALKYEFLIDAFIAHNPFFYELLLQKFPHRRQDIHYLPYGVEVSELQKKPNLDGPLNLVWLARLVELKGINEIPIIDELLKEKGITVNWTIIGDGPESENFRTRVKDSINFTYAAPADDKGLNSLLEDQDIFILPSRHDGLPVAMLETMSRGIVPIMYNFNPGISKIITENIGFIVEPGDNASLAERIGQLHYDRSLLKSMSEQARMKIVNEYDIKIKATDYFKLYENTQPSERKGKWKPLFEVHGKEFHPLIPALLVRTYRKLRRNLSRIKRIGLRKLTKS